ncbi:MAG: ATP-dependent helicase [Thermoplasmata archaeon]
MGIRFVTKRHTLEEMLSLMHPLVRDWFRGKFRELTEPQALAIPLIHAQENVLISSPTGSGKTLTAFLSIINELLVLQESGKLEDRIYCIYISPLKALANDIEKNLQAPLRELRALAKSRGGEGPRIRVAVRSGDTSAYERQKMARLPPHLFITTPESLSMVLSAPRFRENFMGVRYVIVDEIHEVCSSKRGVLLSLTLERLQAYCSSEFTRIGLSATQAPITEIAKFLVGYDNRGRLRPVSIAVASAQKGLDLSILCPVEDLSAVPYEVANWKMYDKLKELIEKHRTTLIFTNTRSGTETVVHKLKERGVEGIAAHHGSLSKETRLEVEEGLRSGKLRAVVCSTSLELGIDIGHIDLVCQIGSPKSIAKGIQRIGRAGHGVYETPKGRIIVFDNDDLVECSVLVKNAYAGNIDRIQIPKGCLDVLAQTLVGMSLERRWGAEEALALIRRSYCYRDMPEERFYSVLSYLAGRHSLEGEAYAKISYRDEDRTFGIRKGSRMIFFLNGGTIPEESSYKVFSEKGVPLGTLSEKFVERLRSGDIFLLGGKTYEFDRSRGMKVFVKDARGRRPTVPSWSGEMLPRTFDLSLEIGRFRAEMAKRLVSKSGEGLQEWLMKEYRCDPGSAKSIISYFKEQLAISPKIPTDRRLVIEGYRDGRGNFNLIFHYCFGRRTNDALSRAYAYALTKEYGVNASISLSDDGFLITLPKEIPLKKIEKLVTPENLERLLRASVKGTELFKQRFRHCAMRSFMILRNYKGREIPVSRQLYHASRILELLDDEEFPVMAETFNEIFQDAMDIEGAMKVVEGIKKGRLEVCYQGPTDLPSPFAHSLVLMGISDIVLMEDRSALLRELHRRVLSRAFQESGAMAPRFSVEDVRAYFRGKEMRIDQKADILYIMRRVGPLNLLQQKGRNVYDLSNVDFETTKRWALELIRDGQAVFAWCNGPVWVPAEELPAYYAIYADKRKPGSAEKRVLLMLKRGKKLPYDAGSQAALRRLEQAYLVERLPDDPDGRPVYKPRDVSRIPRVDLQNALRRRVLQTLEFGGPMSLAELAFALALDEASVEQVLTSLEEEGQVSSGSFTEASGAPQYMLTKDRLRLEARTNGARTFDESQVMQFLLKKQFYGFQSINDYFSRLYEAGMAYDLFNRLESFDLETWWEMRRKGEVLNGRFFHGRVGYIRASDAPLYVSVYRKEQLSQLDEEVLMFFRKNPGSTFSELVEGFSEKRVSREELKEALDKLDRNLYLVRGFFEKREWSSRNRYFCFDIEGGEKGAEEKLLIRVLEAYGPLHIGGIKSATGFDYDFLVEKLQQLEERGEVERIISVGTSPIDLYILKRELPELERVMPGEVRDRMRILSLYDPYVRRLWAEVANRYGEGWFFLVIKNGILIGMVEKWQMSGCVDVRDISLDDTSLLPELLDELDFVMGYYRSMGTDIIRVRRVFGKSIDELERRHLDTFLSKGYQVVQGNLLKGEFVPNVFPKGKALAYLLWKQHIHPENRFKHTLEAAQYMGGLRSDFEAGIRVQLFTPLWRLVRAGALLSCLGIPEHLLNCLPSDVLLYKKAKNRPVDEEMREVLGAIPLYTPISRADLSRRVSLSHEAFSEALKRLYAGIFVIRDSKNRYVLTKESQLTVEEARRRVLRRIVENFGLVNAEALSAYVKHEFKMAELRGLLKEWENEGWLVKGYLVEGSEALFWIIKEDLDKVPQMEFRERVVLSPSDALSHYMAQEIRDRFGMGACFVVLDATEMTGAFKATVRAGVLTITQMVGERTEEAAREFARRWGLRIEFSEKDAGRPTDEWELISWYERRFLKKTEERAEEKEAEAGEGAGGDVSPEGAGGAGEEVVEDGEEEAGLIGEVEGFSVRRSKGLGEELRERSLPQREMGEGPEKRKRGERRRGRKEESYSH